MRGAKQNYSMSKHERKNEGDSFLINQNKTCINTGSSGLQRNR